MSILNGIMKLGTKAVNFTKAGAVKTSEVAAGKINVGNMNLEGLLRSPQADEFIASAGKQNATILSDNIVRFADKTAPYRVITKRLPSGTTVTQAYDFGGPRFKEVITKHGKAISYNGVGGCGNAVLAKNYVTGAGIYKPMYAPASKAAYTPANSNVNDAFLANADGITAFSNKNNADYKALQNMGLVY